MCLMYVIKWHEAKEQSEVLKEDALLRDELWLDGKSSGVVTH